MAKERSNGFKNQNDFKKLIMDVMPTCFELLKRLRTVSIVPFYNKAFINSNWAIKTLITVFSPVLILRILAFSLFEENCYYDTLNSYIHSLDNKDHSKIERPAIDYDGCKEKAIVQAVESKKLKNDKNDKVLQTILLNRKIRDIFEADTLFGVIGKKKCGKSTFVEKMVPGANTEADANIATTFVTPYQITDSVVMMDFPHFDCPEISFKLEFMFTRFLMDHVFFVCNAIERMHSDDTMKIFNLIKNGSGDHFTILLNKADNSIRDCKNNATKTLNSLKSEVVERIGSNYEKNVILTCLRTLESLEQLDRINNTPILTGRNLKSLIYEIILNKLPENEKSFKLKSKIEELKNEKPKYKKIRIIKEAKTLNLLIRLERKIEVLEGYIAVDSFESLKQQLKHDFEIRNPVIRPTGNEEVTILSMEDFFDKTNQHIFTVIDAKIENSETFKAIKIQSENGRKFWEKFIILDNKNYGVEVEEVVNSLEDLVIEFKIVQKYKKPMFVHASNKDITIHSLEDFFTTEENIFVVIDVK